MPIIGARPPAGREHMTRRTPAMMASGARSAAKPRSRGGLLPRQISPLSSMPGSAGLPGRVNKVRRTSTSRWMVAATGVKHCKCCDQSQRPRGCGRPSSCSALVNNNHLLRHLQDSCLGRATHTLPAAITTTPIPLQTPTPTHTQTYHGVMDSHSPEPDEARATAFSAALVRDQVSSTLCACRPKDDPGQR